MDTKKLKLVGSGNDGGRFFFIFRKGEAFFSLFPRFLLGCGFRDLGIYEEYQEEMPDIKQFTDKIEHFKNEGYDIDVIYTQDKIILVVRTDEDNRESVGAGIERITEVSGGSGNC